MMAAIGTDAVACVARDLDDPRAIFVPIDQLANVHVATDCGGRRQPLARPSLAGYMWPELIPPGVEFGYSGEHRDRGPMRIKVLIQEAQTSPDVLVTLRDLAAGAKMRRGYKSPKCKGASKPAGSASRGEAR